MGITLLAVVAVMATGIVRCRWRRSSARCSSSSANLRHGQQAYRGIDWVTIFLFAGMMPVATAMDVRGPVKLIAKPWWGSWGSPSPLIVTAILFILSCGFVDAVHVQYGFGGAPLPHRHFHRRADRRSAHAVLMAVFSRVLRLRGGWHAAQYAGSRAGRIPFQDYIIAGTPLILEVPRRIADRHSYRLAFLSLSRGDLGTPAGISHDQCSQC